jgi:hypothetical protein
MTHWTASGAVAALTAINPEVGMSGIAGAVGPELAGNAAVQTKARDESP